MRGSFPIEEGLDFQTKDLARLKYILNERAYDSLVQKLAEENKKLDLSKHNGYDVFRGQDLTQFVLDLAYNPKFTKE